MQTFIDFFVEPYQDATFSSISLEIIGIVFGITSVVFAKKENIWVYPTGLVSTGIFVFICFQYSLYGDLIINIYYTLMSLYGWYIWSRASGNTTIPTTKCSQKDWIKTGFIFCFTSILVVLIYTYYNKFNQTTAYFDTLTTGIFFAGMWLMANKKIENWLFWMVGNFISIPLYFAKGLGFTAIQFVVFFILAYYGYKAWLKTMPKIALDEH